MKNKKLIFINKILNKIINLKNIKISKIKKINIIQVNN